VSTRTTAPLQRLVPRAGGVHVLAYHLVGAGTGVPVDVAAADFRRHAEELARRGTVVSLDAALDRLRRDGTPAPAVVLTFDDAYRNFATHAWPVLRDLGLPATLYVPTAFVDEGAPVPMPAAAGLPAASWDELAAMREEGLTLGSHSHAHRELPSLPDDEIAADLGRAQELLRRRTGSDAAHFCYPRALWSRRCERVVARFHRSAAIAGGTVNRAGANPLRLRRVPVRREMGADLAPVLDSAVQLREWLASRLRGPRARWRRRS
jgi:peptidoglycan/xylan/chitin deacetylase (PgdA/CDA1 family)